MDLSTPTGELRVGASRHLSDLLGEAERLVERILQAAAARRVELAGPRGDAALLATLGLDGSPLTHLPDLEEGARPRPVADVGDPPGRPGTWFDAMRALEDVPDEHLLALEALGARAGLGSGDLGPLLRSEPVAALEELHRRLTHGLVADERAGRPRRVEQAVHDASTGRMLYFTSDPAAIPGELERLAAWLTGPAADAHPLLVSGVVHLELLRIHPFDAANGRLARTAARLLLRAGGLDPEGLSCPEPELAADPLGYHEEVASTARRRDATIWVERWAEAVVAGLRSSARDLGVLPAEAPGRARAALAALTSDAFTIADYRDGAGADPRRAHDELAALLDSGDVARVPGSRGLRYRRCR